MDNAIRRQALVEKADEFHGGSFSEKRGKASKQAG